MLSESNNCFSHFISDNYYYDIGVIQVDRQPEMSRPIPLCDPNDVVVDKNTKNIFVLALDHKLFYRESGNIMLTTIKVKILRTPKLPDARFFFELPQDAYMCPGDSGSPVLMEGLVDGQPATCLLAVTSGTIEPTTVVHGFIVGRELRAVSVLVPLVRKLIEDKHLTKQELALVMAPERFGVRKSVQGKAYKCYQWFTR